MIYTWHQKNWDQIVTTRNVKQMPHAVLISGAKGIGKASFAKRLVNSLLCEAPLDDYQACDQCKSCRVRHADAHPDYYHVSIADGKTQIVVDQIREFNQFLHMSRSYQGYRVAFISPAESLNNNAANSLLKSLEEPSNNSVIILLTSQLSSILPTIKSRCQLLHLATPSKRHALQWLSQQSIRHNAETLLDMAAGKPLYALALDNGEHFQRHSDFANDLSAVMNQRQAITEASKKWQNASKQELLDWQIHWVQQLIRYYFSSQQKKPPLATPAKIDITCLWSLHDQLIAFRAVAHTSLNAQLLIESMLLLWMTLR
jgi:DNA polymerase-3 subunit delta'